MVSSGMLCTVIQAKSAAFLVFTFRVDTLRGKRGTVWGDVTSSGNVLDS